MAHTPFGGIAGFRTGKADALCHSAEQDLVVRLCGGDNAAYEALIERFEHPVFNLVSRLLENPTDAPDVTQEVFLKVFRNIGSFRGNSSLKTWIYRIAVNESRNQRRWFGRHRKQEVAIDPVYPAHEETGSRRDLLPDPGPSPLEQIMDRERQELIELALSGINPNFRAVLVLREIEGLNYDEISEILEISLGTVKSRILRGREALRRRLTELMEPAEAPSAWQPGTVVTE